MPRLGITLDEVLLAADQIKSDGNTPTIEKIRQIIGAGSNTTISKHLNIWKEQAFSQKINKNHKPASSDLVKLAAEKVWQQIREEADAEILAIQNESQAKIKHAEENAKTAEDNRKVISQELDNMRSLLNTISSEKELLSLDLKKSHEECKLLQEKFNGIEQRYTDFQTNITQHLKDITELHKNETQRLQEKYNQQEVHFQKLVDEIKTLYENQRHQQIVQLDSEKVENKKLDQVILKIKENLHAKELQIADLISNQKELLGERDQLVKTIDEYKTKQELLDKKNIKSIDNVLQEIKELPRFDLDSFINLEMNIHQSIATSINLFQEKVVSLIRNGNLKKIND